MWMDKFVLFMNEMKKKIKFIAVESTILFTLNVSKAL